MTKAERRRRLEAVRGALGKRSKKIPDELIEVEERIEEVEREIERAKGEEKPSRVIMGMGRNLAELKEEAEKIRQEYYI